MGLITVNAVQAIHPETPDNKPPPELAKGQAGFVLPDDHLSIEIGSPVADSTFQVDDCASMLPQC